MGGDDSQAGGGCRRVEQVRLRKERRSNMKSTELLNRMTQTGEDIRNVDLTGVQGDMMSETMQTADGDDFWKEHYRMLLEKVREGIYPTTTDFKTVLQYPEGTDGLTDGIIVSSVTAGKGGNSLGMAFAYSFAEDVAELYWTITFPSLGVSSYGGMAPACQNTEELYWDLKEEVTETEGLLQMTWRCMDGNLVKSQAQRVLIYPVRSVRMDWTVESPVKKNPRNPFILVTYGRDPKGAEQPDYEEKQRLTPDGKRQEMLLECKGKIACSETVKNAYAKRIILNTTHGMLAASRGITVNGSGREIRFNQPKEWKDYVPTKRLSLTDPAYLLLTIGAQFENGENVELRLTSADSGWASQDGSSHAYRGSGSELKIHTLRLVWGCVAEDTQITMADGKVRQISELKQGDRIMSEDGSAAEIATVYSGPERELYVLELADGTRFRASDTHPVMTVAGFTAMNRITVGDSVQMQDGSMQRVVSVNTEEYSGKVYNLQLYGEKRNMYCNGILAGDFITENSRNAAGEFVENIGMNGGHNG